MAPALLPPPAARMLYNVADALLPPPCGAVAVDWLPGVESVLRGRGDASSRRLLRLLRRLEWAPMLRGTGGRFWRLTREQWAALLAGWARSPRRAADHAFLLEVLSEAGGRVRPDEAGQSESGA